MVENNSQPLNKRPRKKKRRLRKPIRIFLWCLGIGSTLSFGNYVVKAFTAQDPGNLVAALVTNQNDHSQVNEQQASGFIQDSQSANSTLLDESKDDLTTTSSDINSDQSNANGNNDIANNSSDLEVVNESAKVTEPIATILVDAGHGGIDPGMTVFDEAGQPVWMEKNINLNAALKFKEAMAWINPEIRVLLVRDGDFATTGDSFENYSEVTELTNRTNMVSAYGANYYLSLHCNSGGSSQSGVELYVRSNDPFSNTLAENVFQAFGAIGWSDHQSVITTDSHPLHVVDLAGVPSMLVEMGYMTDPEDLAQLVDDQQLTTLMEQLAAAYSEMILSSK
ncbi:MAG: N-acetylmuramoyl-L-alanine amidase [Erysipelotrichaceae bacterium]|nr:N-acetylmuramoyl-L-alanine amidase [Erysipelotrichaceae bacterium]